jgi:hypothetical protein
MIPSAHLVVKDVRMTSESGSVATSVQESVVLASFDSYRHAEYMLASLGRVMMILGTVAGIAGNGKACRSGPLLADRGGTGD